MGNANLRQQVWVSRIDPQYGEDQLLLVSQLDEEQQILYCYLYLIHIYTLLLRKLMLKILLFFFFLQYVAFSSSQHKFSTHAFHSMPNSLLFTLQASSSIVKFPSRYFGMHPNFLFFSFTKICDNCVVLFYFFFTDD